MAKKPTTSTIPAARLEAYDRLIATRPGVERKGATIPYTSSSTVVRRLGVTQESEAL